MKKIAVFILFVFLFLIFLHQLTSRRQKIGYWLCQNNKWVKVGNPSYPKPKVSCPKKINFPKTEEECLKQNGVWKKWALFPKETCNLKTIDYGSPCFDNSECQGWCKVQLSQEELRKGMRGEIKVNKKLGSCSKWVKEFGCFGMMEKGKVKKVCFD